MKREVLILFFHFLGNILSTNYYLSPNGGGDCLSQRNPCDKTKFNSIHSTGTKKKKIEIKNNSQIFFFLKR